MSKFKVGDRVRRIHEPNSGNDWTINVGDVGEVCGFGPLPGFIQVRCKGKVCPNNDPDKFELVRTNQKIVVTTDGKTTTARLFFGKDLVKSAEAKCSPRDDFAFETGAALALDRLLDRGKKAEPEAPKFPREELKPGVFGRMNNGEWFVVVNDTLLFVTPGGTGGYDFVSSVEADGSIGNFGRAVDCIMAAKSFNHARDIALAGKFIWSRPGVKFE